MTTDVQSGAAPVGADASLGRSFVFLRPIANPFALGFVGLTAATLTVAGQEIGWIPPSESHQVALIVLLSAPPLQLLACVFGFLGRDPVAATGMGLLAVGCLLAVRARGPQPALSATSPSTSLYLPGGGGNVGATVDRQRGTPMPTTEQVLALSPDDAGLRRGRGGGLRPRARQHAPKSPVVAMKAAGAAAATMDKVRDAVGERPAERRGRATQDIERSEEAG
jgi:hypothetical protein